MYGERGDPAEVWRERAAAIRQTHMRSESDGHVRPRTFPGLAAREAWRRRDPRPLAQSVLDRYRPCVTEFLEDVERVRETTGWAAARAAGRRDPAGRRRLPARGHGTAHVLVATGHPGLARAGRAGGRSARVHAYEPHEYADKVAVVGAGMAAATEWLNALAAGAEVVSIRRREPLRRPLNLPRQLFTKRGLAAFHASPPERRERVAARALDALLSARPRDWDEPIRAAEQYRVPYVKIERDTGLGEQVICATGFRHGCARGRLLRDLVDARRPRDARPLDRAGARRRRPGLTDDTARSRSPASPPSGRSPPPTRSWARSTRHGFLARMSYTLNGRLQSRLASRASGADRGARAPTLVGGRARRADARVGLALDAAVYHRAARVPAGLAALPLGRSSSPIVDARVRVFGIMAPLGSALGLFALGWVGAQIAGHAGFPRLGSRTPRTGGELGRAGPSPRRLSG